MMATYSVALPPWAAETDSAEKAKLAALVGRPDPEAPIPLPDRGRARHLLKEMLRIRRFEEQCIELYMAAKIRGFVHLYIGEEAVAVGSMQALGPDDTIVATYREHGQALARGIAAGPLMAEMYGKVEGCSRGRGGSMHVFDGATRFCGGNAIVAGGLPLALGFAMADQKLGRPNVTACYFGDGAVAEGEFHESLNLAALWQLPVLFLCENNLYAMGTALARAQAVTDIAFKARNYAIPAEAVDGMDVLACEDATKRGAAWVRAGKGPYFVEFRTYRFRPHSMFDAELYRAKAEVEEWRRRDPLVTFPALLKAHGLLDETDLAGIEAEVAAEIAAAVAFAEAGQWEPVEDLTRFVYSERAQT
jgi:pyruvate dehydrogenase E1 component alpha subunit